MNMIVHAPTVPLSFADIDMMCGLFDLWCTEAGIDPASEGAKVKAKTLIESFRVGVRGEPELRAMLVSDYPIPRPTAI